jgi:hypothetical protein
MESMDISQDYSTSIKNKHIYCYVLFTVMVFSQKTNIHALAFPAINSSQMSSRCLSDEEQKLARLIHDYRSMHGLTPTSITYSLTQVAKVHVRDLHENFLITVPPRPGLSCNLHSWSSKGPWTPVCYRPDHALAAAMWNKPREITANVYTGNGYELAYWSSIPATASRILTGWQHSPPHQAVLLETGGWQQKRWPAMGVGIHGQFAAVWFGDRPDPQGLVLPCRATFGAGVVPPAMSAVPGRRPASEAATTLHVP